MKQEAEERSRLAALVARARRRVRANRALGEAGLAATVALLGPVLFLLLGSELFIWPLLVVFVVAGAGLAVWRLGRRPLGLYPVSQVLDARLGSDDQISTAIFFLESETGAALRQRQAAARVAEQADLDAAFPFTLPRSLYGLASVFLVATALCALRYFLEKPLRLDRPLTHVIFHALGREHWAQERRQPAVPDAQQRLLQQARAVALETQQSGTHGQPQPARETEPAVEGPDGAQQGRTGDEKDSAGRNEGAPAAEDSGDPMASDANGDAIQSYEEMLERDAQTGLAKAQEKPGKDSESSARENQGGSSEASNSLLAKLREAMNNMLSRLQQKPSGTGQQQQASAGASDESQSKEGRGEGKSGAGQAKAGGKEASEGEGSESDAQDLSAQTAGKSGGQGADQSVKGQAGSGAGSEEGDKQVRQAQAEAMGKLSELYGRRAANVTGEVTVETQAGKQTLRTPQSQKQARHTDPGGEISRDEIPLAYQAYVKEYFNKLRQSTKK